jgi:ABC-2 type transport system ATP-binding protein
MNPPLLEAINLTRRYDELVAVDGISFKIQPGQCVGLLGPNGAGKTTTVEMLEGLVPPTSGEVRFRGERLTTQLNEAAGIMFQSTALQDYMTVREALKMFSRFYQQPVAFDTLVEQCGLEAFLDQDTRKVSGGQRQRLLLAIALVNNPAVLFLDEPTTGLDPDARQRFWHLIASIQAEGKTIVLTTHYMEEARVLCDELLFMHKGQILAQGSPDALLSERFEDATLTLPTPVIKAAKAALQAQFANARLTESTTHTSVTTSDVNKTLALLVEHGTDLTELVIAKPTLDDLFMALSAEGDSA